MSTNRIFTIIFTLITLMFYHPSTYSSEDLSLDRLILSGHSKIPGKTSFLNIKDAVFLQKKGSLIFGTTFLPHPPFRIVIDNQEIYEGVNADYLELLSDLLNVNIEIVRYPNRTDLIEALRKNKVDFISTSNHTEALENNLKLSIPFMKSSFGFILRNNDKLETLELFDKKVSFNENALSANEIKGILPNAFLMPYKSPLTAITSVSLGNTDLYIGDVLSAYYIIKSSNIDNLNIIEKKHIDIANNYYFAASNETILRIINIGLKSIPISTHQEILNRWGDFSQKHKSEELNLTIKEKLWLQKNTAVSVIIDDEDIPLSYTGKNQIFQGISANVLDEISNLTKLKFDLKKGKRSSSSLMNSVEENNSSILAVYTINNSENQNLSYTNPYLTTPFILATDGNIRSLKELSAGGGGKLAIESESPQRDFIHEHYPEIKIVLVNNLVEAMNLLKNKKVDAVAGPLVRMKFLITLKEYNNVMLFPIINSSPIYFALATNRSSVELISILRKSINSMSPGKISELNTPAETIIVIDSKNMFNTKDLILISIIFMISICALFYFKLTKNKIEELNKKLVFLTSMIDYFPHPFYLLDSKLNLIMCNSAFLDILKKDKSSVLGLSVYDLGLPISIVNIEYYNNVTKNNKEIKNNEIILSLNENDLVINHWSQPYCNVNGDLLSVISGWYDITHKQLEIKKIMMERDDAVKSNNAKTAFLATMSHEIRTPISAITSMLELIQQKAKNNITDINTIDIAYKTADEMLEVIADILDFTRIESEKLILSMARANFQYLIESMLRIFVSAAQKKNISLIIDIDPDANCDVLIDTVRFKQILSNLLTNAIKYTIKGEVRLTLHISKNIDSDRVSVSIKIKDTGIGISPEDMVNLFMPFSQGTNNLQSARIGTGLGLFISKKLANMMGGDLILNSSVGEGTEVNLNINLQLLSEVESTATNKVILQSHQVINKSKIKIIVVDDYDTNRKLIIQQLNYIGYQPIEASNGGQALALWQKEHQDVVITDCNMPVMTGYELSKIIRKEEEKENKAPCLIIGITAGNQNDEYNKCILSGMDICIFKPVKLNELQAALAQFNNTSSLYLDKMKRLVNDENEEDEEKIKYLLKSLLESNQLDLLQLKSIDTFNISNTDTLRSLVHRIKGGAALVDAHAVIAATERVELACNDPLNLELLSEYTIELQEEMVKLNSDIEIYINK
ncbi:ATP-binding protein [Yersinia enterocolitica]|uniref:ATP-binding protein n=1 Tax=Yersinia enterocolitica TaxID=630 RepID=UPI003D062B0A